MNSVGEIKGAGEFKKINRSDVSPDGQIAMESIGNALTEMRVAMAREMNDVNDSVGRNIFNV